MSTTTAPSPHLLSAVRYAAELIRTSEHELARLQAVSGNGLTPAAFAEARDNAEREAAALIERETAGQPNAGKVGGNHAATYCKTLDALTREECANALHQALMQLEAIGPRCEGAKGQTMDNRPAIREIRRIMTKAGHIGFAPDGISAGREGEES